ncbi:hypothetical protein QUB00_15805 [Microcoleus sp. F8_C2]
MVLNMSWLAAREWENWCAIPYGIATDARTSDRFESEMDTRKSSEIT